MHKITAVRGATAKVAPFVLPEISADGAFRRQISFYIFIIDNKITVCYYKLNLTV